MLALLLSCRALWGPGSDPFRSVPTQVGTNYMEWPGLKEVDQEDGQAGESGGRVRDHDAS